MKSGAQLRSTLPVWRLIAAAWCRTWAPSLLKCPPTSSKSVVDRHRRHVAVRRRRPDQLAIGDVVLGQVPAATTTAGVERRSKWRRSSKSRTWDETSRAVSAPVLDESAARCGALVAADQREQAADEDARAVGRDQKRPHRLVGPVVRRPGQQLAACSMTAASRLRWALPIGVELAAEEHAGAHRHDRSTPRRRWRGGPSSKRAPAAAADIAAMWSRFLPPTTVKSPPA